ncbi:TenA family protein [Microtetraspora sp. NBRC 16547]|uniref:TenA family protein n=1 Tax=Microtetraspora sp. NBRC 16547 TaxID=3030993 RepID=UPI0024A10EE5|nr:TenA family protein [Microtetraspora sp. NBRC 16547]GLX02209.1 aminopyrimidine aminohydrolase [Microtetraspora sp. NBRC 16547]
MGISQELHAIGRPLLEAQLAHPTVRGIARGDLPEEVFRSWLEQDYLYLLDYVRVFSRLAWQAPDAHLGVLVDLAYSTWHEELDLHRTLSADFGADLGGAVKGPACVAYTTFLLESAADYGNGLAALYPCMWGYSTLGRILAENPPAEPRYKAWVDTYADPGFAALSDQIAQMIDDVRPDRAEEFFLEGMRHELAFWDVP